MSSSTTEVLLPIPASRRHIIKRPRLTRMLDETSARIIMLVAPAGYGKTTLAREWLAEGGRRFAWYQADASSRDIAAFALGVRDAIRQILPGAGEAMEASLRASASPDASAHLLAELLGADVPGWPSDAHLVIDDYHHAAVSDTCDFFIDTLAASPLRLLLISRKRPTWASPRRRLYGEIVELGPSELVLSAAEAATILSHRPGGEADRLVESARGWPAIIGLAAFAPATAPAAAERLPSELYDYFAEELYKAASPDLRHAVTLLAVAPRVSPDLTSRLLGDRGSKLLAEGVASGLLSLSGTGITMHPLIRNFLRQRLQTRAEDQRSINRHVADALIALDQWDDAFSLVSELGAVDLLDRLLLKALEKLLDSNRLTTISEWCHWARRTGRVSLVVETAEAEVDVRRGLYERANSTAGHVLRTIEPAHPFSARAHLIAARSSHFLSRMTEAYDHATEAFNGAMDGRTRSDAAWTRTNIAFELEREDLSDLFEELIDASYDPHVQTVRVLNGRMFLASLEGSMTDSLVSPEHVIALAREVSDPMVRTSFYSRQATTLQIVGWYEAASTVHDALSDYAEGARLDFVLPYAMVLRANIDVGLRRFEDAEEALGDALRLAPGDAYVRMAISYARAKSLLARQEFDAAAAITADRPASPPAPAFYGEYVAAHAVALAGMGRLDRALALADQVPKITRMHEGRCLTAAARTLVALTRGDDDAPRGLLDYIDGRGCFDAFVTAYRSEPRIVRCLIASGMADRIGPVLARAQDGAIYEDACAETATELDLLTPRQREVVELVAAGLSNREIARKLFISEVTVKVHLRHVFERLNVRSRTEAGVKAALLLARESRRGTR